MARSARTAAPTPRPLSGAKPTSGGRSQSDVNDPERTSTSLKIEQLNLNAMWTTALPSCRSSQQMRRGAFGLPDSS